MDNNKSFTELVKSYQIVQKPKKHKMTPINVSNLVKMDNDLLRAKTDLNITQLKIILSIISAIKAEDKDFYRYRFAINDFLLAIYQSKNKSKNHDFIKKQIKSLLKKTLEIKTETGTILCNWLSGATINTQGFVDIEVYSDLTPYLLQLQEQFTTYKLEHVLTLSSLYAMRIYSLLKQYETTGTCIISIEDFIYILNIKESYSNSNIKKQIIVPAQKEISAKTDITFTFKFEKYYGRKFQNIIFEIISSNISTAQRCSKAHLKFYKKFKEAEKITDIYKKTEIALNYINSCQFLKNINNADFKIPKKCMHCSIQKNIISSIGNYKQMVDNILKKAEELKN